VSLSRSLKSVMPRVVNPIIVIGAIACATPAAALAQPPDPCHSAPIAAGASALER
jgi:hypothetical protein